MNDQGSREEVKLMLAQTLYEGGFGEDADRNWYMACLLLERPDFLDMCKEAHTLHLAGSRSWSAKQPYMTFVRNLAQAVYDSSFELTEPSTDPDRNWHTAQHLYYALVLAYSILS